MRRPLSKSNEGEHQDPLRWTVRTLAANTLLQLTILGSVLLLKDTPEQPKPRGAIETERVIGSVVATRNMGFFSFNSDVLTLRLCNNNQERIADLEAAPTVDAYQGILDSIRNCDGQEQHIVLRNSQEPPVGGNVIIWNLEDMNLRVMDQECTAATIATKTAAGCEE